MLSRGFKRRLVWATWHVGPVDALTAHLKTDHIEAQALKCLSLGLELADRSSEDDLRPIEGRERVQCCWHTCAIRRKVSTADVSTVPNALRAQHKGNVKFTLTLGHLYKRCGRLGKGSS